MLTSLRTLGRTLGALALILVGLHAGLDRVDDASLFALTRLGAGHWMELSTLTVVSKGFVVMLELGLALCTALLVVSTLGSARSEPILATLRRSVSDPTLLRWALPVSWLALAVAGANSLRTESEALGLQLLQANLRTLGAAQLVVLASGFGLLLSGVALVSLGTRGMGAAAAAAERWAARDARRGTPLRRRMRGALLALVMLPIAAVAVVGVR